MKTKVLRLKAVPELIANDTAGAFLKVLQRRRRRELPCPRQNPPMRSRPPRLRRRAASQAIKHLASYGGIQARRPALPQLLGPAPGIPANPLAASLVLAGLLPGGHRRQRSGLPSDKKPASTQTGPWRRSGELPGAGQLTWSQTHRNGADGGCSC